MSDERGEIVAMRFYVASSWRNLLQPGIVRMLRTYGHEVYDFKKPNPGDNGFHWSEVDNGWQSWTVEQYREALKHPISEAGYQSDFEAMQWADACLLVLPSGKSAHLEAGWFAGAGKPVAAYIPEQQEPELMYKLFGALPILTNPPELFDWVDGLSKEAAGAV